MKVTVCELPDETARRARAWADLVHYLRAAPTDVVVLPEMPFCEWEMFRTRSVDLVAWRAALAAHDAMVARLAELETRMVLSSRPVEAEGNRFNQGFSWTREDGYRFSSPGSARERRAARRCRERSRDSAAVTHPRRARSGGSGQGH